MLNLQQSISHSKSRAQQTQSNNISYSKYISQEISSGERQQILSSRCTYLRERGRLAEKVGALQLARFEEVRRHLAHLSPQTVHVIVGELAIRNLR